MESVARRCDFCETTLNTDLEVSLHLISDFHRDNVGKFNQNQPQNPKAQKNICKDIVDVFKALKLRTARDVKELEEKDYFKIPEEDTGLLSVSKKLSTVMLNCVAEHKLRNVPGPQREAILSVLAEDRSETQEQLATSLVDKQVARVDTEQPIVEQIHCTNPVENLPSQSPSCPIAQPMPITSTKLPNPQKSRKPQESHEPQKSHEPQRSRKAKKSQKSRKGQDPAPIQIPAPVQAQSRLQKQQDSRPLIPQTASSTTVNKASPWCVGETQPHRPQTAICSRPPAPRSNIPPARNQGNSCTRPNIAPIRPADPNTIVNTSKRQLTSVTAIPSGVIGTLGPVSQTMAPAHMMPMAGAHAFLPTRPIDEDRPQPRPGSTYTPQLARVKVEPKDN